MTASIVERLRASDIWVRVEASGEVLDSAPIEAATLIEKLGEALEGLVACHDAFMKSQDGFMGNQADAYYQIAKRFGAWDAAREALSLIGEGVR